MDLQSLTDLFLKVEVVASSIENGNDRCSQFLGLVERAVPCIVAADKKKDRQQQQVQSQVISADALFTSPVRCFSLHGVWSGSSACDNNGSASDSAAPIVATGRRSLHAKAAALLLGEPNEADETTSAALSDNSDDDVQSLRQRVFEYRVAALRESLSSFFDVVALATVQRACLPMILPPLHSERPEALRPTVVAMISFRPAVLLCSMFAPAAIEVRMMNMNSGNNNKMKNSTRGSSSSSNNLASIVTTQLLPLVDSAIIGICDSVLSRALATSGFLGPALLSIWWRFFVRRVDGAAMLTALEELEVNVGLRQPHAVIQQPEDRAAAGLLRKCFPEIPILQAIATLLMLDDEEEEGNGEMNSQQQQLHSAAGLCNHALSHARSLRECATGWVASRGSRCCVLALLVRSEIQRRLLRHSSALDDTKDAVAIDEGAKVFSGEAICASNLKVVHSMVVELAAALFPSFGNDMSHAALFGEHGNFATDPFSMAHRALSERNNNHNKKKNNSGHGSGRWFVKDLTTMLVAMHEAASSTAAAAAAVTSQSCAVPTKFSPSTPAAEIYRAVVEMLPIPRNCNFSSTPHYYATSGDICVAAISPRRRLLGAAVANNNNNEQQQLASAEFSPCPSVSERVSWLTSDLASSSSGSSCLTRTFWRSVTCCCGNINVASSAAAVSTSTSAFAKRNSTPHVPPARRASTPSLSCAAIAGDSPNSKGQPQLSRRSSIASVSSSVATAPVNTNNRTKSKSSVVRPSSAATATRQTQKQQQQPAQQQQHFPRTTFAAFIREVQSQSNSETNSRSSTPVDVSETQDGKMQQQQQQHCPKPPLSVLPRVPPPTSQTRARANTPQLNKSNINNNKSNSNGQHGDDVLPAQLVRSYSTTTLPLRPQRTTNVVLPLGRSNSMSTVNRSANNNNNAALPKKEDLVKAFFARAAGKAALAAREE